MTAPDGRELSIRVVAMPADTNSSGDIFGGWLLSQMDLAAWVAARTLTSKRLVTVAMDGVVFHKPVYVGDCLLCYTAIERVGRTSVTVHVLAHAERSAGGEEVPVTEGRITLVALDDDRNPTPIVSSEGI